MFTRKIIRRMLPYSPSTPESDNGDRCTKNRAKGSNLTAGVFIARCGHCGQVEGFSLMRVSEAIRTIVEVILCRDWHA
jgi:hypothetical protein